MIQAQDARKLTIQCSNVREIVVHSSEAAIFTNEFSKF